MGGLTIQTRSEPNAVVVSLIGAADLGGADPLDRQITILSAQHPKNVVFDLSAMTFISSICMGSLVRYRNACTHWGGKVALAGATEAVLVALRRARLDQVFTLVDSVEKAMA